MATERSAATTTEPVSTEIFWDEDENTVSQGVCPSPCTAPQFNFPLETQQTNIIHFVHPTGTDAGWVEVDFSGGTPFDQAWLGYSFEGSVALESTLIQGTQLDPSTCDPLNVAGRRDHHPGRSVHPDGHRQITCFFRVGGAKQPRPLFFRPFPGRQVWCSAV